MSSDRCSPSEQDLTLPYIDTLRSRYQAVLTQTFEDLFLTLRRLEATRLIFRSVPFGHEKRGLVTESVCYLPRFDEETRSKLLIERFVYEWKETDGLWWRGNNSRTAVAQQETEERPVYTVNPLHRWKGAMPASFDDVNLDYFVDALVNEILKGEEPKYQCTLNFILRGLNLLEKYCQRLEGRARNEEERLALFERYTLPLEE